MFKKMLFNLFSQLQEGKVLLEELYRKRTAKKGIPHLSDGEFFSYLRYEDFSLRDIKEAYRDRNFDSARKGLIDYYRSRKDIKFFFPRHSHDEARNDLRDFTSAYRFLIESADRVCAHTMQVPAGASRSFGTFIDWFSDFDGKSWIYCHISELNRKLCEKHFQKLYDLSNLSITLEFNKHHHLVDLGRAYFLSKEERYAQEFVIELEDWIEKNPINWGVNWLEPLTAAQRIISWIFALGLFLPSPHLTPEIFCNVMKYIFLHGTYILEHCADKTTKPAKLIGLASALYMMSSLFPEFEFMERWRDRALKIMEQEVTLQFSPDGVHREQSLGFQCLLTEFLIMPLMLEKINHRSSSPLISMAVERSIEFLLHNIQPNGKTQVFGEMPLTKVWRIGQAPHEDYRALLALGALLFSRGDMKWAAGSCEEEILWFFQEEGLKTYDALVPKAPATLSRAFGEGGYVVLRDTWEKDSNFCLFHSGPRRKWGLLEKGMEGLNLHRDLLNFALAIRGEPFIIETGSYRGKKKFSSYFSRTAAHNVISIDGHEQSMYKNFKGSKKFLQWLKTRWLFTDEFDYVVSGSPGFEDLKSHVIHRREIMYLKQKKWFVIKDTLEGFDEFVVELAFHFAPELEIILRGDYGCFIRGRRDFVRLNPYFPCEFSCSLNRGKTDPLSGWYAKDYVRVEPCYRLEYYAKMKLPAEIYTWVSWARGEFRIPPKEELRELFANASELRGIHESELVIDG
jgi:hypothetical protein